MEAFLSHLGSGLYLKWYKIPTKCDTEIREKVCCYDFYKIISI